MSSAKKRIDTINAIIAGSSISSEVECSLVQGEFNEVHRCSKITPSKRKHLLQVLHSTRALDSTLAAFVRVNSLQVKVPSLGSYLYSLANNSNGGLQKLSESERFRFQAEIVDKRNKFMHAAGAYPNQERVVSRLLSEMHTCISRVASL